MVSDKDGATVATKDRDPVPLKEATHATLPVAAGVPQQLRNLVNRIQLRQHLAVSCVRPTQGRGLIVAAVEFIDIATPAFGIQKTL